MSAICPTLTHLLPHSLSFTHFFSCSQQNRDRLELYALHKQAVQGDAPSNLASNGNNGDQAKYQAWRRKSGIDKPEAMRLYCQEADRQIRVYGLGNTALAPPTANNNNGAMQQQQHANNNTSTPPLQQQQPRGLAAIPLLCAAASESRQAYLRRLAQTPVAHAWWKRQEPLTATPGTLWALPERLLLAVATLVEHVSLATPPQLFLLLLPAPVLQSLLWPWHNSLLALWMGIILIATAWTGAWELLYTTLLGSRRSGWSLAAVWQTQVLAAANTVGTLAEAHQPLTARVMGLCLWPLAVVVSWVVEKGMGRIIIFSSSDFFVLAKAVAYCVWLGVTWWYWFLVLPVVFGWWMVVAGVVGLCFALIELVGV